METLGFKIAINAKPEIVWNSLWNEENYKKWTTPFCKGNYYKTDSFKEGNKIHFLAPDGQGMYSLIDKLQVNKFLAFRHLGNIKNFEELPISNEVESWTNAMETYELVIFDHGTEVIVKVDVVERYAIPMSEMFLLSLAELKKLAESQQSNT